MMVKDFFETNPASVSYLLQDYKNVLPHNNDGLIFSRNSSPYIAGANENFLKWKPAHLNSIDFLVVPNKKSKLILNKAFVNQIVDLYVHIYEENEPVLVFFDFMHIEEDQYLDL